jgi:hypothetical protein
MPFIALVDEHEVEFADEAAIREALAAGRLEPDSWIKDAYVEADWEIVAERFRSLLPDLNSRT